MSDDLSIPNPDYRGNRAGRYGMGQTRHQQGMDPDTRRLVMFAGGLGAVLVVLIGASALIGHHSTGIPVVAPDPGPVRVKPANPGGMKIDGAENDVFSGGDDTAGAKLAPAAESPDTKALRTVASEPAPVAATQDPAEVAPPPPVTRPTETAAAPVASRLRSSPPDRRWPPWRLIRPRPVIRRWCSLPPSPRKTRHATSGRNCRGACLIC